MKWITQKQVKEAAKKSKRAAIAMSKKHWKQLATATEEELLKAFKSDKVDITTEFCALCERYWTNDDTCEVSNECPLNEGTDDCCEAYCEVRDLYTFVHENTDWTEFKKRAQKMYERLCEL